MPGKRGTGAAMTAGMVRAEVRRRKKRLTQLYRGYGQGMYGREMTLGESERRRRAGRQNI